MKILIICTLILFLILVFLFLNIGIYLRVDESVDIRLKIGRYLSFKVDSNKIVELIKKNIDLNDLSKVKYDSKLFNNLLKYITIEKLTLIETTNLFLDTWNIYTNFLFNLSHNYINALLNTHFYKVKDVYYSISYNTIGSFKVKIEALFSIKVYKLLKYLIIKRRHNGKPSE